MLTFLTLLVLISVSTPIGTLRGVVAQLTINAQTPPSVTDGTTQNTILGIAGSTVASALLDSGTPAMLWGIITSNDVNTACQYISGGSRTLTANVNHNWGDGTTDFTLQVTAAGGCLASPDSSGTEIVLQDQNRRTSAVVCPTTAARDGCAIFVTGDDVNALQQSEDSRRRLLSLSTGAQLESPLTLRNPGRQLKGAVSCLAGGIIGAVVGVCGGLVGCFGVWTVAPWFPPTWCVGGVIGVSVGIGFSVGCSGCFPGHALVQLHGGYKLPIEQLSIGDKVAVWNINKQTSIISYEEVYAFGHKSSSSIATFVKISMEQASLSNPQLSSSSSKTLEISPFHFLPTTKSLGGKVIHKRAKDIVPRDYVWAAQGNSSILASKILPYVVTKVSITFERGLFNPFTMGGTILVDGVLASVHSEWFLDNAFDKLGLSHYLPLAYQVILSPVRVVFQMLGDEGYSSLYNFLDNHWDLADKGTAHGGTITFGSIVVTFMAFVFRVSYTTKRSI